MHNGYGRRATSCADPEIFVRGGRTLTTFFFLDYGREDPNTTENAIKMAFHRRADDGPASNAGLAQLYFFRGSGSVLLTNPIFCDFSVRGGPDTLSPLCFRTWTSMFCQGGVIM